MGKKLESFLRGLDEVNYCESGYESPGGAFNGEKHKAIFLVGSLVSEITPYLLTGLGLVLANQFKDYIFK